MTVLVVEPIGKSYSHVPTNSGFIATISLAFPTDKIVFLAEEDHQKFVYEHLKGRLFDFVGNIDWVKNNQFNQSFLIQNIWLQRLNLLKIAMNEAGEVNAHTIVFLSLDGIGISLLKWLLLNQSYKPKILCVMHGVMTHLAFKSPKSSLFRYSLLLGNDRLKMQYLVITPTIYTNAVRLLPQLTPYIEYIDHPQIFINRNGELTFDPEDKPRLVFGFLGSNTTAKGFDIFEKLAIDVKEALSKKEYVPDFVAIGRRRNGVFTKSPLTQTLSTDHLSSEEYARKIESVDYLIFPYSSEHYALRASAAILDAFEYLKPSICFKIPLFEDYFNRMGNIGYLCDGYEYLYDLILKLIDLSPVDEYRLQQRTILSSRSIFSPQQIVLQMQNIFEK